MHYLYALLYFTLFVKHYIAFIKNEYIQCYLKKKKDYKRTYMCHVS